MFRVAWVYNFGWGCKWLEPEVAKVTHSFWIQVPPETIPAPQMSLCLILFVHSKKIRPDPYP